MTMPTRSITRRGTIIGPATGMTAPVYVDSATNLLKIIPAGSGSTEVTVVDTSATSQTKTGGLLNSHATAGIGYATGAGGTVTQATSKSTGVTLNTVTGLVTMNAAALAADAIVSFTLTNSAIAATDMVVLQHDSAGTVGAYVLSAQPGAGSAVVNVANRSAASLSEAIVLRFAVIKSINA